MIRNGYIEMNNNNKVNRWKKKTKTKKTQDAKNRIFESRENFK